MLGVVPLVLLAHLIKIWLTCWPKRGTWKKLQLTKEQKQGDSWRSCRASVIKNHWTVSLASQVSGITKNKGFELDYKVLQVAHIRSQEKLSSRQLHIETSISKMNCKGMSASRLKPSNMSMRMKSSKRHPFKHIMRSKLEVHIHSQDFQNWARSGGTQEQASPRTNGKDQGFTPRA